MNNPWIEFVKELDNNNLVLKEEHKVISEFNSVTKEDYQIHTEIMPAPFMGDVHNAPILLLMLNPGYNKDEEERKFYITYGHFWKNEIQHIQSIPNFPLFCLDNTYSQYSDYWKNKLKPIISISDIETVAKNICQIQFFPYHSEKYKSISKKILEKNGFDKYLISQEYNFHLVRQCIKRNAFIILTRSKKEWFEAIPELKNYKNLFFTRNPRNPSISLKNCPEGYPKLQKYLSQFGK